MDLAVGTTVSVTTGHPFYVDASPVRKQAGWVAAGHLLVGDRLRTASGHDVTVTGVRYNEGQAAVYTLTVGIDHTFFVGVARVLVHNANCPIKLEPYSEGGGHHIPAKSAFRGAANYDLEDALAISNAELARLKIDHAVVTGMQHRLYRQFASTGQTLTWADLRSIETQALVAGGASLADAQSVVDQAIAALQRAGVAGPTRIPWG